MLCKKGKAFKARVRKRLKANSEQSQRITNDMQEAIEYREAELNRALRKIKELIDNNQTTLTKEEEANNKIEELKIDLLRVIEKKRDIKEQLNICKNRIKYEFQAN